MPFQMTTTMMMNEYLFMDHEHCLVYHLCIMYDMISNVYMDDGYSPLYDDSSHFLQDLRTDLL